MNSYRIVEHSNGFEPQIRYTMGFIDGEAWFPLDASGHWLEPDAFSYGQVTMRLLFANRADAERVILRAKSINEENISVVSPEISP